MISILYWRIYKLEFHFGKSFACQNGMLMGILANEYGLFYNVRWWCRSRHWFNAPLIIKKSSLFCCLFFAFISVHSVHFESVDWFHHLMLLVVGFFLRRISWIPDSSFSWKDSTVNALRIDLDVLDLTVTFLFRLSAQKISKILNFLEKSIKKNEKTLINQ